MSTVPNVSVIGILTVAGMRVLDLSNTTVAVCRYLITLTSSSGQRNVTVWRLCVRLSLSLSLPVGQSSHTQRVLPGAARDAASVHFSPSITRTDRLICSVDEHQLLSFIQLLHGSNCVLLQVVSGRDK